jgi:hypothetical protein
MGLWRLPSDWDDFEWFRLADVPDRPARPARQRGPRRPAPPDVAVGGAAEAAARSDDDAGAAMGRWLVERLAADPPWTDSDASRVLLVDLDNLRAAPSRLRARLAVVVALARDADHAAFAGQVGAVRRSKPWLEEFADDAQAVPDGSDLADHALLDHAKSITVDPVQFLIVSNDGIFSSLAERGPLALLSPGAEAMSDRLRDAAHHVTDLAALEKAAATERARAQRASRRRSRR